MKNKLTVLLIAVTLISTLFVFAGCGSSSKGEVYVYSYGDYFDPNLAVEFEKRTGIRVIVDSYDTAEEMYTVMENNATSYDCICTSDYMIGKMISHDMLSEINYDNITNIENINDIYMSKSEEFDPGNKFSVPYMVGSAGILYDTEQVGDIKIDSWDALWNKRFNNKIVMPDSMRDAFMISLKKQGYSANSTNENEIKAAAGELIKQKTMVYKYANDSARDLLADGSATIGVVWNGEYVYTKSLNEKIKFTIPKEGTEFFVDSWVIPKDAKNKENAEKWIDFLTDAKIAAKNFEYLNYTTPNKAALEYIDEEYKKDSAIFPSEEEIKKFELLKTLDNDSTDLYSKYWKKVKAK